MLKRHEVTLYFLPFFFFLVASGCTNAVVARGTATPLVELPIGTSVAVEPATLTECATGGLTLKTFQDADRDGILDNDEKILTTSFVCNGTKGDTGNGAGIRVTTAPNSACPAGGTVLTTFIDSNNNATQDSGESSTSTTTVCNGVNSVITATAVSSYQCLAGGTVYSTHVDGQSPTSTIICNGVNGSDGNDAGIKISAIGPAVPGKPFTACHHDALYIPDYSSANRGWLIFRHQANGSADQGIGNTGFNVWNVDIANFSLVSEIGNTMYCNLTWNPSLKKLSYSVVETTYGFGGQTGNIQF